MARISRKVAAEAATQGIMTAIKEFDEWMGEYSWSFPEYVFTTYIARELGERGISFGLENNVGNVLKGAEAVTPGPFKKRLKASGRADIVLYRANEYPFALIEVKRQAWVFNKIASDFERISLALLENPERSSLDFTAIAFSLESPATLDEKLSCEERLTSWIDCVYGEFSERATARGLTSQLYKAETETNGDTAWGAYCMVLSRPRS